MNHSHSHNDKTLRFASGLKAAALVSVLGLIVMIADRSLVAPAEVPLASASSSIAPYEATSLSADGRGEPAMATPTAAQSAGAEQRAPAPTPRLYPEPASDAVRDENGHPPSF